VLFRSYINRIKDIQKDKIIKYINKYKLIIDEINQILENNVFIKEYINNKELCDVIKKKYNELIKYDEKN
jgi:hypothetical protein